MDHTWPRRDCGDVSPTTLQLRPRIGLDPDTAAAARRLKRQDPDATPAQIARQLAADEADVVVALATLRTPNPRPSRATINATLDAAAYVESQARPGEPAWQTLNRLLGELAQLRAQASGPAGGRGSPR